MICLSPFINRSGGGGGTFAYTVFFQWGGAWVERLYDTHRPDVLDYLRLP